MEALIRKYAYAEIRNNAERFRYQNLTARYNTFNELWNKRLRAMEEGRPMGIHGLHERTVAAPPPAYAPAAARGPRAAGRRGRVAREGPRRGRRGRARALRPVPGGAQGRRARRRRSSSRASRRSSPSRRRAS